MSAKVKTVYVCQVCGAIVPKWAGQCGECHAWNTLIEEVSTKNTPARFSNYTGAESNVVALAEVNDTEIKRITTTLSELDRVLGGGLVDDSTVLLGGDPGIGKSTLLLQALCELSKTYRTLYITGEESLQQIALRAKRLEVSEHNLKLAAVTPLERILELAAQEKPAIMAVDSIQTIYTESLTAAPGSASQIRECTAQLVRFAKTHHLALFIVGHVTKEGMIAGPKVLEHIVDCVLYFEGTRDSRFRVIRATKNRFGAVNELGIFAMTEHGLKTVVNPSAIFLANPNHEITGSAITTTWEGSRPLLIEVQALVDESHAMNPRRIAVGCDANRLALLLAVLHRHTGISTYDQDVFVNVVGGVRISETALDLALLLAIFSSIREKALPRGLIAFGEVGLSGEIRPVQCGQERLKAVAQHGFTCALIPLANAPKAKISDLTVKAVKTLSEALQFLRT